MTVRRSLHIGLNSFNPVTYGRSGTLMGCENDAHAMEVVARGRGFLPKILLTAAATTDAVLSTVASWSQELKPGDFALITYSGHGGQVEDVFGDEPDKLDETWCLYDSQLIDDEIAHALAGLQAGVRVVVMSDSCHSGSVTRRSVEQAAPQVANASYTSLTPKLLTIEESMRAFSLTKDRIQGRIRAMTDREVGESAAAVILLPGCADDQESLDGPKNGAFTAAFLLTWSDGAYSGNYNDLVYELRRQLPETQQPTLFPNLAASAGFVLERVLGP